LSRRREKQIFDAFPLRALRLCEKNIQYVIFPEQ